tara:strand:- start:184 stop:1065 length:882 start_codon:yes stop_codon:yes gene_type:complete
MKKLIILMVSVFLPSLLVGCNTESENTKAVESAPVKPAVELIDFISDEIKIAGEEYKYYEILSSFNYSLDDDIFTFYMKGREDVSVYEQEANKHTPQKLLKLWDMYYADYSLENYFHHYMLQKGNVNVMYSPEVVNMTDPVVSLKQKIKKLMVIHNAIYVKTAGNTKKLDFEQLDFSDQTVEKVYQTLKDDVINKAQLVEIYDNTGALMAFGADVFSYKRQHRLNSSLLNYFIGNYSEEGTEFIFSRLIYDMAELKLKSVNESNPEYSDLLKMVKKHGEVKDSKPVYNFAYNY